MSRRRGAEGVGQGLPRAWVVVAFWPIMVAIVSVLPLVIAILVSSGKPAGSQDLWATLRLIGTWAGPLYDDALSLIAIIATFLVTLAAAAGFAGNWKGIPRTGRHAIAATLCVSLAALRFIAMFAAPVLMAASAGIGRVLYVLVAGWLTALVGMTVTQVSSPEQRVAKTRDAWRVRKARASIAGLSRHDGVPLRQRLVSEIVVCAAPLVLWTSIGTALVLIALGDTAYLGAGIAVVVALAYRGHRPRVARSCGSLREPTLAPMVPGLSETEQECSSRLCSA